MAFFSPSILLMATLPLLHAPRMASDFGVQGTASALIARGQESALTTPDSVTDPRFELVMVALDDFHAGKAAKVELLLEAKAPFKCNDKYPFRFQFKETAGIDLTHPTVDSKFVEVSGAEARMTLPFVPLERGRFRVEGIFHFSVCSVDKCLMEKQELGVEITVR